MNARHADFTSWPRTAAAGPVRLLSRNCPVRACERFACEHRSERLSRACSGRRDVRNRGRRHAQQLTCRCELPLASACRGYRLQRERDGLQLRRDRMRLSERNLELRRAGGSELSADDADAREPVQRTQRHGVRVSAGRVRVHERSLVVRGVRARRCRCSRAAAPRHEHGRRHVDAADRC